MMEIVEKKIDELKPWDKNPRINDHAVDAVAKSISAFGFNVPILCDQNMTIIAGHTRWKAAQKLGMLTVPVTQIEMTGSMRKAFAIADNKTAEIADWNLPELRSILDELKNDQIELACIGFSDEDIRKLYSEEGTLENKIPEIKLENRVNVNDHWRLGNHTLVCGDSMDSAAITSHFETAKTDMVFSGPPYLNLREYSHWETFEDYLNDMFQVISNCFTILRDGGIIVWNVGNLSTEHLDLTSHHSILLEKAGFQYLDTIAWVKSGANFSVLRNAHIARNKIYYPTFQWESLLIFQKPGKMIKMTQEGKNYMMSFQTNVWEIPSVPNRQKRFGHPDVCPVELPYRCIQAYSGKDAIVFEPFGGSGTTLIAAEKSKRRAIVFERKTEYCDVILSRWEKVTGEKAVCSKWPI